MIPRYGEWQRRWPSSLTVLGVHTPEMDSERNISALRRYVADQKIAWRVLLDPDMVAWNRFGIEAWPTIVLIDRSGVVRAVHVGDGESAQIEAELAALLGP
jgi:hypothetical protein